MKKLLSLYLFTISLLSVNVLAAAPASVGSVFRDAISFLKGIFTGTATMDQAYFFAFILYFIMFLAIFVEGLRLTPLFGRGGTLNKQGKVFAVAASGLATLALFVIDMGTKQSTPDKVARLVSPFGIWGGVVIAGVIAYLTYRAIRHSGMVDEDKVLQAGAFAAALGVTLAGMLLNMETLLGWGFFILVIVSIVLLVSHFVVERGKGADQRKAEKKEMEEGEAQRIQAAHTQLEKKRTEKKKRIKFNPAIGFILHCIEGLEKVSVDLRKDKKDKAEEKIEKFHTNLENAWNELKKNRRDAEGDERNKLDQLSAILQNLMGTFDAEVLDKINNPPGGVVWNDPGNLKAIDSELGKVKLALNTVLSELEKLIK